MALAWIWVTCNQSLIFLSSPGVWLLGCHNSEFRNRGMTALLKVSSCDGNADDYYDGTYEDISTFLLNENVIEPRSFSQNSRNPISSQNKFQSSTIPGNDLENLEHQAGERTQLHRSQSVSSSDLLMLLEHPTPSGRPLSELHQSTVVASDYLPKMLETNSPQFPAMYLQPEFHLNTPEPEIALRLKENLSTTISDQLNKLEFSISSSSNDLVSPTTLPGKLATKIPDYLNTQLDTIGLGRKQTHFMGSDVSLGLNEGNNNPRLIEEAVVNSQESPLGVNVLLKEQNGLLEEKRGHGPTSLTKDNSLFNENSSFVKTDKTLSNSTANENSYPDAPALLTENKMSIWQDILKNNTELEEVTYLTHNETFVNKDTTNKDTTKITPISNESSSSKSMDMVQGKEDSVPQGEENLFFKMQFLPRSASGTERTSDESFLNSKQRPGHKQPTSIGSEQFVQGHNSLSENKGVGRDDEFAKDTGFKALTFPYSKDIPISNLENVQENDTHMQRKKSQEDIEKKEPLVQETSVSPLMHTVIGTNNFLKTLFLSSTRPNAEHLDEGKYTPILNDSRSSNDLASTAGDHIDWISETKESINLEGLGKEIKHMVEEYPDTTSMSPVLTQQNVIVPRTKRALQLFRLALGEREVEKRVVSNDALAHWPPNMKYLTIDNSTQIEFKKKKGGIIQSLLANHWVRSSGTIQTNGSVLPVTKILGPPSIKPTDLSRMPSLHNSSLLAEDHTHTFTDMSPRAQVAETKNYSLAMFKLKNIGGTRKRSSLGESAMNPIIYKNSEDMLLLKSVMPEVSGQTELLPQLNSRKEDTSPTKASSGSFDHLNHVQELVLQKTQGPVKRNKVNGHGKKSFLKWAPENSGNTPSHLLDPLVWDNQYANQTLREMPQKNIVFNTMSPVLTLNPWEDNHLIAAISEGQEKPQKEANWANPEGTRRMYFQNPSVLKRHPREATVPPLPREEDNLDYDDVVPTESKSEDFDIYDEDKNQGPRSFQKRTRHYFIAAVEQLWDYGMNRSPYSSRNRYADLGYSLLLLW